MNDYTPVHTTGLPVTFTASAAVVGGTLAEVTGDMTVATAPADSQKVAGVFAYSAPAGSSVVVHTPASSVEEVNVSAAVTAGQHVKAASSGRVAPFVVGTDAEVRRLGLCISGQATADNPCRYLSA
jgi:hypothetical protein